jgi:3-oxoacyl-[acyl-carrier-protein] synthase II
MRREKATVSNMTQSGSAVREVVVSGMGVVSPIGIGHEQFCESLYRGLSGIDFITLFDASRFSTRFAGEAKGFKPKRLLAGTEVLAQTNDRRILLAAGAAQLAMADAGLAAGITAGARCAVMLGSGIHPVMPAMEKLMDCGIYENFFDDPDRNPHKFTAAIQREGSGESRPFPIFNRANAGAFAVARQFGIAGPCQTIVSACAAATQAIGLGFQMVRQGEADIVLSGGYDSMIFNFGVYAFCLLGLMSTCNDDPRQAMKPFDRRRDGFALGEGAGVLILEERQHALNRGAKIYARIAGYGSSIDAYKVTDPHPEGRGAVLAMQAALRDAGMSPADIGYINAHGTATPKNDRVETMAIKEVFGSQAYDIPVSSTKSMIGHLMAAGGALELIATILGMNNGFIPPTINYQEPDPNCDLVYVPNKARNAQVSTALSNSFGLGGQNASIIVSRN